MVSLVVMCLALIILTLACLDSLLVVVKATHVHLISTLGVEIVCYIDIVLVILVTLFLSMSVMFANLKDAVLQL